MKFATLNDALIERRSSARSIHYIEGENNERALPFGELHSRALGLLHHFQACGATPGSEMILLLDSNAQFVDVFWACILGNLIAVPLAPGATDEHKLKFFRVLDKLKQPHLCTDGKIHSRLAAFASRHSDGSRAGRMKSKTVFIDRIDDISRPGKPHAAVPDDIAFVQYFVGLDQRAERRGAHPPQPANEYCRHRARHQPDRIGQRVELDAADARHGIDRLSPDAVRHERYAPPDVDRGIRAPPPVVARASQ